ncbi:KINESIN LIGHT CHAIN-RELATED 2-like [Olea europaea subsp. europaea]|uniref:KINESIN LIGHT CHAIN-RELATED 2-like n=1 Tax=Olea europaea subsp. europaea TaxID=158383 RepID=A0A8S0SNN7_OLEEU|nr:KINESIN LIGHT CHAIN-RELATED 2-like [Olea europaea subsp. europaea]
MAANGQNADVAAIDSSIGDAYLSLKRDSKSYCENALRIYSKPVPGSLPEEIASGRVDISAIYISMNEPDKTLQLLQKAIKLFKECHFKVSGNWRKEICLFGITLNQMGLACVKLYSIKEAADFFEEARSILEAEYGSYHADTLRIYSNLAGTYYAMGRTADAIEIMEYVAGMREEEFSKS